MYCQVRGLRRARRRARRRAGRHGRRKRLQNRRSIDRRRHTGAGTAAGIGPAVPGDGDRGPHVHAAAAAPLADRSTRGYPHRWAPPGVPAAGGMGSGSARTDVLPPPAVGRASGMSPAAVAEKGRPRERVMGTAVVRLAGRSMVAAVVAAAAGTAGIAGAAGAAAGWGRRGIGLAGEADSLAAAAAAGGDKVGRPRKSRLRTCLDLAVCVCGL